MKEIYTLEDTAIYKINISLAGLYNYLIQPFLDMREVAFSNLKIAKEGLENPNYGVRKKTEFATFLDEWQHIYSDSIDRIQELYLEYYSKTSKLLTNVYERMLQDRDRFGNKSFSVVANDRFHRVQEDMCLENIQLYENQIKSFQHQCDKVKINIALLERSNDVQSNVEKLENEAYRWNLKIMQKRLTILIEKEKLLNIQSDFVKNNNEEEFFDAMEDCTVDILNTAHNSNSLKSSKLGAILRKKAQLRNQINSFKTEHEKKLKEKLAYQESSKKNANKYAR